METPFSQKITCRVLSQLGFASLLVLAVLFVPLSHAQSDYATPYTFTTFAGTAGVNGNADGTGAAAQFQFPNGVAVDASGNVYVTDSSSEYTGAVGETIRKITPAGVVTTLAGVAGVIGSTDGTGTSAQFNNPFGIAVDGSGNLYIGDTNNDTIRKVTPAGVVTTLAGTARVPGSAGGTGAAARFNNPYGVAVDESGNVYVADCGNNTIRKIAISSGVVTTVAGTAGVSGSADGTGVAARFSSPTGITVDGDGNLYVADGDNCTIRKISPSGAVTTLAGTAGMVGDADGTGPAARFALPGGIAVDGNGNLFVTDDENFLIRKITPSGVVTTLAGTPPPIRGQANGGSADGTGAAAQFYYPSGIAVDGNGYLYVADSFNYTIRKGYAAAGTPQIQAQPTDQYTAVGGSATFSVTASGSGTLAYQWNFNGSAIAGATGSSYTVANAQASNDGPYTVTVTNSFGSVTSSAGTLYVNTGSSGARLINIATRALVGTGGNVLIPGFVIGGSGSETLLIRADGPALTAFGVTGALAQPSMTLTSQATGATLATNTGWGTNTNPTPAQIASIAASVGAFGLTSGSADSALVVNLQPGAYTIQISGVGGTTGVGLAEVYEVP